MLIGLYIYLNKYNNKNFNYLNNFFCCFQIPIPVIFIVEKKDRKIDKIQISETLFRNILTAIILVNSNSI
jgi:hypothetical protein